MIFCTREIGSRDFPDSLTSETVGFAVALPFGWSRDLSSGGGGGGVPGELSA